MLRQGLYVAENDESIWNAYSIEMRVKETDKSYIFELVKFESRYAASHIETFFSKDKRVVLRKNKGGHAMRVWGDDSFTFYPYQAGIPYYFKLAKEKAHMEMRIYKDEFNAVNAMAEKHKDLSLSGDKYLIRPFKDWYDFLKEGSELHHAVHYYAINQYRRGEDYLFAMRKTDEPDAPFITLEFDLDGNLKQARKLNNALAKEEDELAFVNEFRKKVLMPYIIEQKKSTTYLHLLETFCKEFGSYVTGNWKENHLNIYIHLREEPLRIACYGLGKVNWSGESDPEYPFHKSLQELLPEIPKGVQDIHVEYNCGRMYNVNLTVE